MIPVSLQQPLRYRFFIFFLSTRLPLPHLWHWNYQHTLNVGSSFSEQYETGAMTTKIFEPTTPVNARKCPNEHNLLYGYHFLNQCKGWGNCMCTGGNFFFTLDIHYSCMTTTFWTKTYMTTLVVCKCNIVTHSGFARRHNEQHLYFEYEYNIVDSHEVCKPKHKRFIICMFSLLRVFRSLCTLFVCARNTYTHAYTHE